MICGALRIWEECSSYVGHRKDNKLLTIIEITKVETVSTNRNILHIASCTPNLIAHLPPKRIGVARRNVGRRLNGCFLVKDNHYSPHHGSNPCKIGVTMRDGLLPLRLYAEALSPSLGEVSHLRFLSSNAPVSLALHKGVVGSIAKRDAATLGTWAERLHREFL